MTDTKRNLNRTQCRDAIANREAFTNSTGSLVGKDLKQGATFVTRGWLNDEEFTRLTKDSTKGIAYLVMSYDTPIAWVMRDGRKYRVSQKFSVTTSKHMGLTWVSDPIDNDA